VPQGDYPFIVWNSLGVILPQGGVEHEETFTVWPSGYVDDKPRQEYIYGEVF